MLVSNRRLDWCDFYSMLAEMILEMLSNFEYSYLTERLPSINNISETGHRAV